MYTGKDIRVDDLRTMTFVGTIVDSDDPEFLGRCRVRVHGKLDEIEDGDLPWACSDLNGSFGTAGSGGMMSVPRVGALVTVRFDNGNIYSPMYGHCVEPSPELVNELKKSYQGAHSLWYDDKLRVFYTRDKGIEMYLDESHINIESGNAIVIEHKGTKSIIELRGGTITITADSEINMTAGSRIKASAPEVWVDGRETKAGHVPAYSMVAAEPLFAFLKALSAMVDAKFYPTPSAMVTACEQAEMLATSKTCKVSL